MKSKPQGPIETASQTARRLATRCFGAGPSGVVEPFAWHLRRQHPGRRRSLSHRERFTGIISQAAGESFAFEPFSVLAPDGTVRALSATHPPTASAGIAPGPAATVFSLCPGAVAGSDCVVYCPETRVAVEESIRQWDAPISRHPLFSAPRFPRAETLPGVGLVLGVLSIESFYHFLLECLPKLSLCRPWWDSIDHFIVNGKAGGYAERWLLHAGIPAAKLRWLGDLGHFRCEQLLFTGPLTGHHYVTPTVLRHLHALWPRGEAGSAANRRIWISRRGASARDLRWESSLLAQLPGFETVVLQDLSPAEQISLMRSARVIAGPHGAGLAGMVFAPAGTQVWEFCEVSDPGANTFYSRLAQVAGLRHRAVQIDFQKESDVRWLQPHFA